MREGRRRARETLPGSSFFFSFSRHWASEGRRSVPLSVRARSALFPPRAATATDAASLACQGCSEAAPSGAEARALLLPLAGWSWRLSPGCHVKRVLQES